MQTALPPAPGDYIETCINGVVTRMDILAILELTPDPCEPVTTVIQVPQTDGNGNAVVDGDGNAVCTPTSIPVLDSAGNQLAYTPPSVDARLPLQYKVGDDLMSLSICNGQIVGGLLHHKIVACEVPQGEILEAAQDDRFVPDVKSR